MHRLRFFLTSLVVVLIGLQTPAAAQSIAGRFVAQNPQGATIVLVFNQDAQGQLTGSLSSGQTTFQIEGMVDEEGVAVGAMSGPQAAVFFQAETDGRQLLLTLIEPGPDNMPDYSQTQQVLFTRDVSAGAAPTPTAPAPTPQGGNPFGRGGAAAAQGNGLIGNWSCQTGDGPASLSFRSGNQLTFNGESAPYQVVQGAIRVNGDTGPVDYPYQLNGDQLSVTGPGGWSAQCRRQSAAEAPMAAPGATGMEGYLQGRLCSFSSSPDGGMSTLYIAEFDGQGRFRWGTESSFSSDVGSAYGRNPGNMGTYRVTAVQVGAPIYFTLGGETVTGQVKWVYQGAITEFEADGRHYGKGICQ